MSRIRRFLPNRMFLFWPNFREISVSWCPLADTRYTLARSYSFSTITYSYFGLMGLRELMPNTQSCIPPIPSLTLGDHEKSSIGRSTNCTPALSFSLFSSGPPIRPLKLPLSLLFTATLFKLSTFPFLKSSAALCGGVGSLTGLSSSLGGGMCGPGPPNADIPKSGLGSPLCVLFSAGFSRCVGFCTASFLPADGELLPLPGTSKLALFVGPTALLTLLSFARSGVCDVTTGNRPADLSLRCRFVGAGERSLLASEIAFARASIFSLLEDSSVFTFALLTALCRWL